MAAIVTLGPQDIFHSQYGEHKRYEYDLKPTDVVYDIGAYNLEFADEIQKRYHCMVRAFEPTFSPGLRDLRWEGVAGGCKIFYSADGTLSIYQGAAWIYKGTIVLGGEHNWVGMHELDHREEYPCLDINQFIIGEKEIALMKINIEGGEYNLLSHILEEGLMGKIRNLQVQFHYIEGRPSQELYDKITGDILKTHEKEWGTPFVWESWKLK